MGVLVRIEMFEMGLNSKLFYKTESERMSKQIFHSIFSVYVSVGFSSFGRYHKSYTLRSGINVEPPISVEVNFSSSNWRLCCLKTCLTGHKWTVLEISSRDLQLNYKKIWENFEILVQKLSIWWYSDPQLNSRTSTFIPDVRVGFSKCPIFGFCDLILEHDLPKISCFWCFYRYISVSRG